MTEKQLTVAEAVHAGILDMHESTYCTESGDKISIQDAIHSALIQVEYHEDPNAKPEVVTKTYAVHGVVDQKKKDKVTGLFLHGSNSSIHRPPTPCL